MADRPVIVDEQVSAERPRRGSRRRLFVAALASLLVIGGLFAARRDDSQPAVQVTADQPGAPSPGELNGTVPIDGGTGVVPPPLPETASTTAPAIAPAPTTTTTQPAHPTPTTTPLQGTRTPVMTATDGRWKLTRVDSKSRRCLELEVGTSTAGRLLCDAPAPAGLWGDYATVTTPIGTVLVAMVDRKLTDTSTLYDGVIAQFGGDPTNQDLHYAVGVINNLGGSNSSGVDLFLRQGENTLGRANVSLTAGPHPAPNVVTTAPYGTWAGYRKAGYTGLFYGGNEDVGFYDNPSGNGTRCVLWRRFGGLREGVILDVCPPSADAVFPFAELRAEGPITTSVRAAIVVDAPRVTRWTCTWDTGGACFFSGSDAQVSHDPAGSGRSFLAYFPGAFQRNGDHMTVTAYDGERTLGQITLDVKPA